MQALSAALGTCVSSCIASLHASELAIIAALWLVFSPSHHTHTALASAHGGMAALVHACRSQTRCHWDSIRCLPQASRSTHLSSLYNRSRVHAVARARWWMVCTSILSSVSHYFGQSAVCKQSMLHRRAITSGGQHGEDDQLNELPPCCWLLLACG